MDFDDDDFDDLLAGVDDFPDSSQESLTAGAAKLAMPSSSTQDGDHYSEAHPWESTPSIESSGANVPSVPQAGPPPAIQWEIHKPLPVQDRIQRVFDGIAHTLSTKSGELSVVLRTKTKSAHAASCLRRITFPGKSAEEAWRFTVIVRILHLIYDAIRNEVVLSKRDIYYRDPALFGNQGVVDRYVDNIAYTFDVPRAMLNVTAAAKGLVAGAFKICRRDGSIVNAACEREGLLVPVMKDVLSIDISAVKWVLVIEKEASFRSIAASTFWDAVSTQGVILTGKGYPDFATRALLHQMCAPTPQNGFASPPAFCLVDFDPDGLAIMSTYKNGSATLVHEKEDLRVRQLQWLGLGVKDMIVAMDGMHSDQGLLSLTTRDRRKAVKMLERCDVAARDAHEVKVRSAWQTMLMLNTKAELQLLDASPRGMVDLLTSALLSDVVT